MNKSKLSAVLAGLVVGLAAVSTSASAASITWQAAVAETGSASDIVTTGSFFDSFASSTVDRTVNGVTFNRWTGTASNIASYGNGSQIKILDPGSAAYVTSNILGMPGGWNSAYAGLVHSSSGNADGGGGTAGTIQINGLTAGNNYMVQIFMPFWDADWRTRFGDGTNFSEYLDAGASNGPSVPDYVIGTFTADAASQSIYYQGASSLATIFAGMQVRSLSDTQSVPEPSSMLLLGIGALGIARLRRRARG